MIKKLNLSKKEIINLFHLDKVDKREIEQMMFDFRFFPRKFGSSFRTDENYNVILEEAKRTYSYEEVIKELRILFSIGKWQVIKKQEANKVEILILVSNIGNNKKSVIDALDNCGWFFIGEQDVVINNKQCIILNFAPMFQEDVSNVVMTTEHIFHWTPQYALDSIMKYGLVPKSENKLGKHPDRIYFMSGNIPYDNILNFGKRLCKENKNSKNNKKYVLLKINTCDARGIKFYYDPHAEQSFYTTETIKPDIIHVERIYDF